MTQRAVFFWQQNRENVQGWVVSLLFHGAFVGATVLMMTNIMEVKKPEPIRLDMALLKPPPKPVQQFQPVHKTVVAQQRVERQEFKKEVSKKEIVVDKIEETHTEERTKQTTTKREMVQVTETVETQVPQQQRVTSQAVPRVAAATPVTSVVSVKPVSNANHRSVATVPHQASPRVAAATPVTSAVSIKPTSDANHRQVATIAQPTVKGHRQIRADHQVKRPATIQDLPVLSVEKATTTESTTQQISASVKKVTTMSSESVTKSTDRVRQAPIQRGLYILLDFMASSPWFGAVFLSVVFFFKA